MFILLFRLLKPPKLFCALTLLKMFGKLFNPLKIFKLFWALKVLIFTEA